MSGNIIVESVPTEDQPYVDRTRSYIQDTAVKNDLEGIEESTDLEIYYALDDTLGELSYEFGPHDMVFNSFSEVPLRLLQTGAMLNILVSKGLLSARNTLTYTDQGGVTIQDQDQYGRYTVFYNMVINRYRNAAQSWKRSKNINGAYGGVHSEYLNL
jgi:hypothetical protein